MCASPRGGCPRAARDTRCQTRIQRHRAHPCRAPIRGRPCRIACCAPCPKQTRKCRRFPWRPSSMPRRLRRPLPISRQKPHRPTCVADAHRPRPSSAEGCPAADSRASRSIVPVPLHDDATEATDLASRVAPCTRTWAPVLAQHGCAHGSCLNVTVMVFMSLLKFVRRERSATHSKPQREL